MKHNLELLEKLFVIPSPSGYTKMIIDFIENYVSDWGFTVTKTKKGNLVIDVIGEDKYTIGLSAHVDTLGLMVRSINNDGHLNFARVGGVILPTLDGEYCTIHTRDQKKYTGTILSNSPSVHVYDDANSISRNEQTMYIRLDENVKSKQDTLNLGINNGDYICLDPKFVVTPSGYIKSRFLDDKASVYILIELLRYIKETEKKPKHSLKIIMTTYEEVGHGASYIGLIDELLAVDMGCIGKDLMCNEEQVSICAKDGSGPYDYDMTTKLIRLAKKEQLDYAVDIYPYYSSDASAALRGGNDLRCALLGSGIHASHGMERTHLKGIEATLKLLIAYIEE